MEWAGWAAAISWLSDVLRPVAASKINPGIIVIGTSSWMPSDFRDQRTGPHSRYVSNGATMEGYAGVLQAWRRHDRQPTRAWDQSHWRAAEFGESIWPDPVAGVHGAAAIAMALYRRFEETGRGQRIDLSQAEALVNTRDDRRGVA